MSTMKVLEEKTVQQDQPNQILHWATHKSYFTVEPKVTPQVRFKRMHGGEWPTFTVIYVRLEHGEQSRIPIRDLDPNDERDASMIYNHVKEQQVSRP